MKAFLEISTSDRSVTLLAIDKIVSVTQHNDGKVETQIVMINGEQYWVPGKWRDLEKLTRAMF